MNLTTMTTLIALATGLSAQSFYVPSNTPSTGTCNAFPFATTDMRYQALLTQSDLGGAPVWITGFGLAPCSTGVRSMLQITMRIAPLAATTLSTTFDNNLAAGATTVLSASNFKWSMVANTWSDLDLQVPFFYSGTGSVVVELLVVGSSGASGSMHRDATNQRVYLANYTGQATGTDGGLTAFKMRVITGDASAWTFGAGCAGSNTLVPTLSFSGDSKLSSTLTVQQTAALPLAVTALVIGSTTAGPNFPVDLTPLNAPGCLLYTDPLVVLGTLSDASGASAIPLGIPSSPSYVGVKVYTQWLNLDAQANGLGLTTSNYGRVLIGN